MRSARAHHKRECLFSNKCHLLSVEGGEGREAREKEGSRWGGARRRGERGGRRVGPRMLSQDSLSQYIVIIKGRARTSSLPRGNYPVIKCTLL